MVHNPVSPGLAALRLSMSRSIDPPSFLLIHGSYALWVAVRVVRHTFTSTLSLPLPSGMNDVRRADLRGGHANHVSVTAQDRLDRRPHSSWVAAQQ